MKYKFKFKFKSLRRLSHYMDKLREDADECFALIADSVEDNHVVHSAAMNEAPHVSHRKPDPRWFTTLSWLASYKGEIVEIEEVPDLTGRITDVSSVVIGTPLLRRKAKTSKLVLATEVEDVTVLVNIRGALHRSVGYITDSRVEVLRTHLPEGEINVSDENDLAEWFEAAGLRRRKMSQTPGY